MTHRALWAVAVVVAACSAPARAPRTRMSVKEIVERSKPAIVQIVAAAPEGNKLGTGFAVDPAGVIATNLHVVSGAQDIEITTLDGARYHVERIVGMDPDHDLALLGITPKTKLPVLPLGDSDVMEAGDPVIAIGNPAGLDYTVSHGLISSVRRDPQITVLQISAPISQGSSGGPLFNVYGEVIGTATGIYTEGQNLNIGMPSNYLAALIKSAQPLTLAAFAEQTRPPVAADDSVQIVRQVPDYDVSVLDGCTDEQAAQVFGAIDQTIDLGAPLYNQNTPEGISACYKIYEGTSLEWSDKAGCPGVRQAFRDGLTRAGTMGTDKAKAWALRDTFDGLLKVIAVKYGAAAPP